MKATGFRKTLSWGTGAMPKLLRQNGRDAIFVCLCLYLCLCLRVLCRGWNVGPPSHCLAR